MQLALFPCNGAPVGVLPLGGYLITTVPHEGYYYAIPTSRKSLPILCSKDPELLRQAISQ